MTKLLKIFVLGFLAFGFVACDKVSNIFGGSGSKQLSVKVEQYKTNLGDEIDTIIIQANNATDIKNIIINGGNCPISVYEIDYNKREVYSSLYPTRAKKYGNIITEVNLKTTNGNLVKEKDIIQSGNFNKGFIDVAGLDYYNALDEESKAIYASKFPISLKKGEKIGYLTIMGNATYELQEKLSLVETLSAFCDEKISKVEVFVNDGERLEYDLKG